LEQRVKVQSKTVADVVCERIQQLILGGSIKPAEKLPSERKLAAEFNVSRVSLRQGIAKLEELGLLIVKKDGTYVCDVIAPSLLKPFEHLFNWYSQALFDMFELRKALEVSAVGFAAKRLCEHDKKILTIYFERFEAAIDSGNEATALEAADDFHLAIADCSYNLLLATILRSISSLLKTAKKQYALSSLPEFKSIQSYLYHAIMRGDEKSARLAIEQNTQIYQNLFHKQSEIDGQDTQKTSHSISIDRISARIEHLIICGHYDTAEQRVSADDLSRELQQPPSNITDALDHLVTKSLLKKQNGLYYVRQDNTESIINEPLVHLMQTDERIAYSILELRIILERYSSQSAAQNQDKQKQIHLKQCFDRLLGKNNDNDPVNQSLNDYEFHLAIADMSDNLALTYLMRGLFNLLRLSISNWLALFNQEIGDSSIIDEQHNTIYQAIINSDSESAGNAMQQHLQFVADTMRDIIERKEREVFAEQRWRFFEGNL